MRNMWIFIGRVSNSQSLKAVYLHFHHSAASIVLLILAIACSIGVSLSLQKLLASYDDRCILHADLRLETEQERLNYFFEKYKNSGAKPPSIDEDDTEMISKSYGKLMDKFNESYAYFLNRNLDAKYPTDQIQYLFESKFPSNK